jgi:hypothetical protein
MLAVSRRPVSWGTFARFDRAAAWIKTPVAMLTCETGRRALTCAGRTQRQGLVDERGPAGGQGAAKTPHRRRLDWPSWKSVANHDHQK